MGPNVKKPCCAGAAVEAVATSSKGTVQEVVSADSAANVVISLVPSSVIHEGGRSGEGVLRGTLLKDLTLFFKDTVTPQICLIFVRPHRGFMVNPRIHLDS